MNVETILAAAIALVSAVGGATAFFRQSLGNNVIKLQASEIATLTGKNSRLEKDNAALASENRVLRSITTGSPTRYKAPLSSKP